jgi:hypothetical protein
VQPRSTRISRHRRGQKSRADTRTRRPSQPSPVSHPAQAERRLEHRPRVPHHRVSEPVSASRRPVVEVAAPGEPTGLDTGHESAPVEPRPRLHQTPAEWVALACNGAAALVAVAAALRASRRRGRRGTTPLVQAQVLHLPVPTAQERRAA